MSKTNITQFVVHCLLVVILPIGQAAAAKVPADSDFIDNLPALQPNELIDGLFSWEASGDWPSRYNRFVIEEIEIFIHPDTEYRGIEAKDFLALTESLRLNLIDALEPRYPVVNKPGEGVALIRIAITGVKLKKREKLVTSAHRFLLHGHALNKARRPPLVYLDDASMEMEILDSTTGERFGIAIDSLVMRHGKGKTEWESLHEAFKLYASKMRQYMDDASKNVKQ